MVTAVVRGEASHDPNINHIAVPTTAGSGEATHFAVYYIGKDKFSLARPWLSRTGYFRWKVSSIIF